jgi:hypothetical protein
MTRILIAFLAGSLLTCAGAIAADYRTGIMFIAGGILLLVFQVALLASLSRARAFARFIVGVCDSLEQGRKSRPGAPEAHQQPNTQVVEDLTSALMNMGMKSRKHAIDIATQSAAAGGTLPEMIMRATQAARVN